MHVFIIIKSNREHKIKFSHVRNLNNSEVVSDEYAESDALNLNFFDNMSRCAYYSWHINGINSSHVNQYLPKIQG